MVLNIGELEIIGELSPTSWSSVEALSDRHDSAVVQSLLDKKILIEEGTDADLRDISVRSQHWRGMSAAAHYSSRWANVDTEQGALEFGEHAQTSLLSQLGPPPPPVRDWVASGARISLPLAESTPLESLLQRRVTCRNFDSSAKLDIGQLSSLLYRAFGARATNDDIAGVQLLKKGVPSAGGLHPTEAYLLVQGVNGLAPGLYHYHPVDHVLELIATLEGSDAGNLAKRFVAAQSYFSNAHVLVVPTSRFVRNFWKYRNHTKAYRALVLDVGHISQTLYLAATELGLGAFITAAINEVDIEQAFGLDPLEEGPLAVCGFGIRAAERKEVEFDPLHAVWPAD